MLSLSDFLITLDGNCVIPLKQEIKMGHSKCQEKLVKSQSVIQILFSFPPLLKAT